MYYSSHITIQLFNEIYFLDEKTKRRIFNIHTGKMTLADDVNIEDYIMSKDDLSGADIKAICTEAGLMALRYGTNILYDK